MLATLLCVTVPGTAHAVVVQTNTSNTSGDTAGLTDAASSSDVLTGLVPSWDKAPYFDNINGVAAAPSSGVTEGSATTTASGNANGAYLPATYPSSVNHLPFTATFTLPTTGVPDGWDLTRINSFAGWHANGRTLANQKFEVLVKRFGEATFISLGTYTNTPFTAANSTGLSSSLLRLTNSAGTLATNVTQIKFIFQNTGIAAPNTVDGFVIKELDIFGTPHTLAEAISLSLPKTRQVIQRNSSNTGSLTVSGTCSGPGTVARIEARAVVMAGSNSGTTTAWTTIATNPASSFTGQLTNVAAGGWYRIEVRSVDAGSNVLASNSVDKVGVGDLFVTVGQSNAACFGSPTQMPGDDRVSAYNYATLGWQFAVDPQPNPSDSPGTGGSPWPHLGTLLVQGQGVPVGFYAVARGSASVLNWVPASNQYYPWLRSALQFLGTNGCRAVLWHQGETDALTTSATSATTYCDRLQSIIAQSRIDAGWNVPWGVAEASFHPSATIATVEPVAAGQRLVDFADPLVFRGARTDDLHIEGKLNGTVHFNQAGLDEHAQLWANALMGIETLTPKNGNFESPVLADGKITNSYIIAWNRLNASGLAYSTDSAGIYNPNATFYSNSADTINGGVLPGMSGRNVAYIYGTGTNNCFLQTLPAMLCAKTAYALTVAFGVRDNVDVYGGHRLELLANGQPLGSGITGGVAQLNALAGGSAAGKFTQVTCTHHSPATVTAGQSLAVRITKTGTSGVTTYVDFDSVNLTAAAETFLWSGATDGTWADSDATSGNFSGLSFAGVKADTNVAYFADTNGVGQTVTRTNVAVGAGGASIESVCFQNDNIAYTLTSGDANGIKGATTLTKSGAGKLILSGANTYTGATTVSSGTLLVNGSLGNSTVTVNGRLGGTGVINGPVTINGTLSPGNNAGTLSVSNNLALSDSAVLDYELGTSSDCVAVTGNLTLDGTLNISDSGGFTTNSYALFTYTGILTNNGLTIGTTPGDVFVCTIDTNTPYQVNLNVALTPFAAWQVAQFGSFTNVDAAAAADPDHDRMNNEQEFLAGTVPTNGNSVLRVDALHGTTGVGFDVSWPSVSDRTYRVAYSQSLPGEWRTNLPASLLTPLPGQTNLTYTDTTAGTTTNRFYRINLVAP